MYLNQRQSCGCDCSHVHLSPFTKDGEIFSDHSDWRQGPDDPIRAAETLSYVPCSPWLELLFNMKHMGETHPN